jgi:hypothetical protein
MSAPAADAADEAERRPSLASLPPALTLQIFSLLPVDARARAACLSRGFHAVLSERSAWTRLDLSPSSGVTCTVTNAVLEAAASKAGGALTALDVSGCEDVTFEALHAVVAASSGTLRELCAGMWLPRFQFTRLCSKRFKSLLRAAPQLHSFVADVHCFVGVLEARRLLRSEPPFQALRVRLLSVYVARDAHEASMAALAADVAAHASLTQLQLVGGAYHSAAALNVVLDAALARRLTKLSLLSFWMGSSAFGPALARLLHEGDALTELHIDGIVGMHLLDAHGAALVGAALRANATLTHLSLRSVTVWQHAYAPATLLAALTAHRSLRALHLGATDPDGGTSWWVAGADLGALVAANAPALHELCLSHWRLGDDRMRPLVEALRVNTHLRTLHISDNRLSDGFLRDVVLPAVRANTGLRELHAAVGMFMAGNAYAREAEALVRARGVAAASAASV